MDPRKGEREMGRLVVHSQYKRVTPSHHVIQSRPLVLVPQCHTAAYPSDPMDQNSLNSHSTRSTFFSRVYPTPQSSNNPRSYPSTTRPHTNAPSFFGKSHISHSAGRNPENHTASQILQGGDGSVLLPLANTEDGSIYVGHKYPQYLSRSIEATNSRHPYDNMDSAAHVSHSSRLKLSLSASRTGMLKWLSFESRI
jgi:hypothetical protein